MPHQIDLRSDTVTQPSPEMLLNMMAAQVGDDVLGDDPSINALEEKAAKLFGMEAGLFCPSGTMTNQIALQVHAHAPGEVICDRLSHIYNYEGGGVAYNARLSMRLLAGENGILTADQIAANINPDDIHFPPTQLVCLENSCNKGGGSIYQLSALQKIHQLCQSKGLKLHLDGARIFNALAASGDSTTDIGKCFDTISVCLSKGLGAPVGSLLLGDQSSIHKARRLRKIMGGGMRQAGYLAAAGSYALDHHVDRLQEDHQRARSLASILSKASCVTNIRPVITNIVIFEIDPQLNGDQFIEQLAKEGLGIVSMGSGLFRMVTHLDFTDDHLNEVERIFKQL